MTTQEVDPRIVAKYVLQYQNFEDNIVKFQLETKKDLEDFKNSLQGLEYSPRTQSWVLSDNMMAIINTKGANALNSFLNMHINRMVSLSNYENDEHIEKYSFYDIKYFIYFLTKHKEDFGFVSYPALSLTISTIDKINTSTMLKAWKAGERDTIRKSFTLSESQQTLTQKNQSSGFFGNLFGSKPAQT